MNKNKEEDWEKNPIKIVGIMIPAMPSLMFRLTGTLLRFKSSANKAGKVFRKELIKQGIDEETAENLTETYMKASHIRQYIQGFN